MGTVPAFSVVCPPTSYPGTGILLQDGSVGKRKSADIWKHGAYSATPSKESMTAKCHVPLLTHTPPNDQAEVRPLCFRGTSPASLTFSPGLWGKLARLQGAPTLSAEITASESNKCTCSQATSVCRRGRVCSNTVLGPPESTRTECRIYSHFRRTRSLPR